MLAGPRGFQADPVAISFTTLTFWSCYTPVLRNLKKPLRARKYTPQQDAYSPSFLGCE